MAGKVKTTIAGRMLVSAQSIGGWPGVVWCCATMGVALGGFWGARFLEPCFGSLYLPSARLGAIVFLLVLALLYRRRSFKVEPLLAVMVCLLVVQLGAVLFVRGDIFEPEVMAMGFVAGCSQGAFLP